MCRGDAARTMAVMQRRARQAHLTIEFDGDRIIGELRDERGTVSAFSGWLELISALDSLATSRRASPDRDVGKHPIPTGASAVASLPCRRAAKRRRARDR